MSNTCSRVDCIRSLTSTALMFKQLSEYYSQNLIHCFMLCTYARTEETVCEHIYRGPSILELTTTYTLKKKKKIPFVPVYGGQT